MGGSWRCDQIFLGFCICKVSLRGGGIIIPGRKRAGDTVLFDALFGCFGCNSLRAHTLRQIRSAIEHFKFTNALWNYFSAPIAALMGCVGAANLWVTGINPDFWTSPRESAKEMRLLRWEERKWAELLAGRSKVSYSRANALPAKSIMSNGAAIGRSTPETADGLRWYDCEFLVLDAPPAIRHFKRHRREEIIIGEIELLATIRSAIIWGMRDGVASISIVSADNLNVFELLKSWKAKSRRVSRIPPARIDYLIGRGIQIITMYVRSGRNFARDHLSRTDQKWNSGLGDPHAYGGAESA